MRLKRLAKRPSSLILAALVIGVTALAGCGGSDKGGSSGQLGVNVNADPFAGPAPLAVRFTSSAKSPAGNVRYHWRFDDGTSSNSQNPAHSFPRPGYYTVILDAFDQTGERAQQSLLLGGWGAHEWAVSQRVPLTKKRAIAAQREQRARTTMRLDALAKRLRQELAGALE
jgi:hypothetical protein